MAKIEHADTRGAGVGGALNHLGVEVDEPAQVAQASARLAGEGLDTLDQQETTCCYAVQDKVWVEDPDATPWEIYTVLADAEMPAGRLRAVEPETCGPGACCDAAPATPASACCDQPVA